MSTSRTKQIVEDAFIAWSKGEGTPFELLADDVRWTVTGSSDLAGTFTSKQQFMEQAIAPLAGRLSQMITPTIESVVAEDDWAVVLWSGHAVATDGQPYDNRYSWHMRLDEAGKVVEVIAFFDAAPLDELFRRVKA